MAVLALDSVRRRADWRDLAGRALASARLDTCAVPPLALALGAAAYFAAPVAPPPIVWITLILLAFAGRWLGARNLWRVWPRWAVAALAWAALGYGAAGWRTWSVAEPMMADGDRTYQVTGWVAKLDPGSRPAVTIAVSEIELLSPEATPARVRVRITGPVPSLGDGVTVLASLGPPPGPAAPGDYDFSRQSYFDRLGGTGFSYGSVSPAEVETRGLEHAHRAVAALRGAMADRIRSHAPDRRGGILAALVTGDRSGVTPDATEALREAGLAHLLAISGLHMALVGGGAFALASFLFALVEPWSRARDVRKPAACVALFSAAAYLLISGAPVSAQRAFIMLAVMFVAMLFDRRALTLRNVAVAAVIVLLLAPESLFEAGFQMSFAATAALIAAYEAVRARRLVVARERSVWAGSMRFLGGLSFTSLVAGAATGAFAAFHFNRMATYGMAGNLAAMPIFTIWVAPLTALGAVLTPFGLDGPAFKAAALGVGLILRVSEAVSNQAGSITPTHSGPPVCLAIYSLGFVLLCAGRGAVRASGLAAMALAWAIWAGAPRPVLWVSDTAVVAGAGGGTLYATDLRRSRYGVSRFGQRQGLGEDADVVHFREIAGCDSQGCIGWLNGVKVAAPVTRAAAVEDCADADLVAYRDTASARLRRTCGAILLDGGVLAERGPAMLMREKDGTLSIRHADQTAWRAPYPGRGRSRAPEQTATAAGDAAGQS